MDLRSSNQTALLRMSVLIGYLLFVIPRVQAGSQDLKQVKVTMESKRYQLSDLLEQITTNTGYVFMYEETLKSHFQEQIEVKNVSNLQELINAIADQASLSFRVMNQNIIIREKPMATLDVDQQGSRISGTIRDEAGEPLVGATVVEKGTTNGVITDLEGQFLLMLTSANPVLIITFIGYEPKEVSVGSQTIMEVTLQPSVQSLDDVVVTALGIEREERSLGYAVSEVKSEEMTRVAQENVLNSLSGKMPGVTVNSTGAAGSSVSVIIRGNSSLSSDNQPLYVVNGVPVNNTLNNVSQIGEDNPVDYGNAISDINPEDIESISVLKGPSAAALYGSRAANGVVLITTKTGKGLNKMTVSVTSNTLFEIPYKFIPMQTKFAVGVRPYTPDSNPYTGGVLQIDEASTYTAGPELDKGYSAIQWNSPTDENGDQVATELVSHKNNVKNFVQTGITSTNGISIANSTERLDYRMGVSNMSNRGLIPNSDYYKNTLSLSADLKVWKNLTVSTNMNFSDSWSNNRPAGNQGTNPLQWAYYVSPHIDIRDLANYWEDGQKGIQQLTENSEEYNNPYFLANEVKNSFNRDHVSGNLKLNWQISKDLSFFIRHGIDQYSERRETKIAYSYTDEPYGAYGIINIYRSEHNTDFLASYKKEVSDFNIGASVGGNFRYQESYTIKNATEDGGTGLIIPGVYSLSNIASSNLDYSSQKSEKGVYSLYGMASLGYKDWIYTDLSIRNDWSSTLPANNNSYFYPAASVSFIANEILPISKKIDMLKLRAGWARVGNDTDPYQTSISLSDNGEWGSTTMLSVSQSLLSSKLKPEIADSWEFGLEGKALTNRVNWNATYYFTNNRNQIFNVSTAPSSGYTSVNTNGGRVNTHGWEFVLGGAPVVTSHLRWDVSTNFTRSRSVLKSLANGMDVFELWSGSRGGAWAYVGDKIGAIYDRGLVTVTDKTSPYYGYPILDSDGGWQAVNQSEAKNKIGNFNPNFIMGFQTSLTYKSITLNMTFDWRNGGSFVSQTYRYLESDMRTQRWQDQLVNPNGKSGSDLRNWLVSHEDKLIKNHTTVVGGPAADMGGFSYTASGVTLNDGVFNPGVMAQYDGNGDITGYTENLGGSDTKYVQYSDDYPWDFFKTALFPADYLKLREISIAYQLPHAWISKWGMQNMSFSIYSRNIILWTKAKIGIDPERAFQPSSGGGFYQGIERYNVTPWTFPVGFKLNATF